MTSTVVKKNRGLRAGQTLIIAILIMGVLMILGLAFVAIINRNVTETGRSAQRTLASDMARAGAEYAHSQLVNSPSGADWRPDRTNLIFDAGGFTKDPDALYLRPASGLLVEPDPVNRPGFTVVDQGGPDYLGPFSRIPYDRGRALLRVRFAPQDYDAFVNPTGSLRAPGQARSFVQIETIGRVGTLDDTGRVDPSLLLGNSVQVAFYADQNQLRDALGQLKAADSLETNTRRMVAFANIGIIETARYITNKWEVSRPADVGMPTASGAGGTWAQNRNTGVLNEGLEFAIQTRYGANDGVPSVPRLTGKWDAFPGGASVHSNAELLIHGNLSMVVNRQLGEGISATGGFRPANDASSLNLSVYDYDGGTDSWVQVPGSPFNVNGAALDSRNPSFNTNTGILADGRTSSDPNGYSRAVPRKDPPSITRTDPSTGLNRYRTLTAESNMFNAGGQNIAAWGYGNGIYVDSNERGNRPTDRSREQFDPAKSMPNDWLNPNNANSLGWQGQFYIPVAPYVRLLPDGFEIIRDARSTSAFWRNPVDGSNSGQLALRYWVRRIGARTYIVDQISAPGFAGATAPDSAYVSQGREFNGVVMFAGDVRVRGVIPTDVQLTLVSMGTIYVEGSITKGVTRWNGTSYATINRPSQSMIGLLAQDFVTVNTTMFFGPAPGESVQPKSGDNLPDTPNPIELEQGGATDVTLNVELLLDQTGNDPAAWRPLVENYAVPAGLTVTGSIPTRLMTSVSADDNGPSFAGLQISPLAIGQVNPVDDYLFPVDYTFASGTTITFNAAAGFYGPLLNIPAYGLGDAAINAYPKFETIEMPFYTPGGAWGAYNPATRTVTAAPGNPEGPYTLAFQDPTLLNLRLNQISSVPTKNLLVAKAAMAPHDIRIEAVMFAENGSFFVIPGNWFNSNSDDTRTSFEQNYTPGDASDDLDRTRVDYGANLGLAQQRRFERFGNSASVPFYAEPLDVKVTIVGAVSENMPAPVSQQAEWMKKWGWIPRRLGGSGLTIPNHHRPANVDFSIPNAVPNFQIAYDPALATSAVPTTAVSTTLTPIRVDDAGNVLPPLPRLPVSPTLAYFGDSTP